MVTYQKHITHGRRIVTCEHKAANNRAAGWKDVTEDEFRHIVMVVNPKWVARITGDETYHTGPTDHE